MSLNAIEDAANESMALLETNAQICENSRLICAASKDVPENEKGNTASSISNPTKTRDRNSIAEI